MIPGLWALAAGYLSQAMPSFLAVLARSAGSIWPAVAWHAATNAGALLLEGLGLQPTGPPWLADGSWFVLTVPVEAALALVLARWIRACRGAPSL